MLVGDRLRIQSTLLFKNLIVVSRAHAFTFKEPIILFLVPRVQRAEPAFPPEEYQLREIVTRFPE